MPTLNRFRIKNFRGIQDAEINIDVRKKSDVVTLIGLNESGKTTILEALSHFSTGDRTIANLVGALEQSEHLLSLIPIDKRAAFNGDIRIEAEFGFEPAEFDKYVAKVGSAMGIHTSIGKPVKKIRVEKAFIYKDSEYQKQVNYWGGITFQYKKTKNGKPVDVTSKDEAWLRVADLIEKDLYEILYFPTFIVDMPSKIYLQKHSDETPINLYYRTVLSDVIASIGEGLDLEKHVLARLNTHREKANSSNWFQDFWAGPERKIVDAVFHKVQQVINREVIGSWEKVFNHPVRSRSVKVEWGVDTARNDIPFVSFGISDGHSVFSVHERSLGFRWFFSYLLFTQFRSKSGKKTIFLFDEPAANLHAKAQMQLMDSIARIVKGGNKVIYSTHSPHMINPSWLSDAVIIENQAVNVEAGDDIFAMDTKPTDIKATGYGKFVSEYPEKTTYFQPVWEKLLYEAPPVIGSGPFLCVEGISDFHFLSYVKQHTFQAASLSIIPGVGAGGFSATLPSLYGMGAKFVLLLDDDVKGRAEKQRYIDEGIIASDQVFTLADVSQDMLGMKLENLLSASVHKITERFNGKSSKRHVAMYLAEANAAGDNGMLDEQTIAEGGKILNWFLSLVS
ncbi:ATP-binding protein [Rhizobium sp. CB3060]|uniref:ATP-dependent nuclease n=1 Tax=Rhizobium sp. CB3060 TaxID=3138255 RepID=UPI0021A8EAD2|nr:ATP-binding protein [Rhizobium tropici]UWU20159.1 ATP-binding protein [Rhizobium tropici]